MFPLPLPQYNHINQYYFELALEITQTMLHLQIFIITRMNLMVLRFGHLMAPFKEIFNRKLHYNLVELLTH